MVTRLNPHDIPAASHEALPFWDSKPASLLDAIGLTIFLLCRTFDVFTL